MSSMTFKATIEQARPNPDSITPSDADLRSVFYMLNDEDAARLTGALLRNAAFGKRALDVGDIDGFRDHGDFSRAWFEHARAEDHEWTLHLPVALVFDSGDAMYGGLLIRLTCVKDREPRFAGMSIHT